MASYFDDIVDNYNSTYHSTIKAVPEDVIDGLDINHREYEKKIPNIFKVGDMVRITGKKTSFRNADTLTYSKDVDTKDEIDKNNVSLEGVDRGYQPHQLKKANQITFRNTNRDEETIHSTGKSACNRKGNQKATETTKVSWN